MIFSSALPGFRHPLLLGLLAFGQHSLDNSRRSLDQVGMISLGFEPLQKPDARSERDVSRLTMHVVVSVLPEPFRRKIRVAGHEIALAHASVEIWQFHCLPPKNRFYHIGLSAT